MSNFAGLNTALSGLRDLARLDTLTQLRNCTETLLGEPDNGISTSPSAALRS